MIPLEITIYCDKSNSRNVIRKIGFKDEPWMDKMKTGTSIDFIEKRYMVELQSKLDVAKKALEFYAQPWERGDLDGELLIRNRDSYDKFEEVHERARQALKEMES